MQIMCFYVVHIDHNELAYPSSAWQVRVAFTHHGLITYAVNFRLSFPLLNSSPTNGPLLHIPSTMQRDKDFQKENAHLHLDFAIAAKMSKCFDVLDIYKDV